MIFAKREVITARGAALARRVGCVCDLGALGCAANLGELDVTPEVERAREQSRVFLLAARRCNEFQPLPSGYLQFLFVPSLVLYAFAIEVGFKALRCTPQEPRRGGTSSMRCSAPCPANSRPKSSRTRAPRTQVTSR